MTFRLFLDRVVRYLVEICGFATCGLIVKICGFVFKRLLAPLW
jgi:hypothetical protein